MLSASSGPIATLSLAVVQNYAPANFLCTSTPNQWLTKEYARSLTVLPVVMYVFC